MGANNTRHRPESQRDKRLRRNTTGESYRNYKANRPRAKTVPLDGRPKKENISPQKPRAAAFSNKQENEERSMDTKTQIEYKPKTLSESEKSNFDSKFKPFFEKVAGADGEIDAFELKNILNSAFKKEMAGKDFSLEACRSMVAMVDRDRNGMLDYDEFRTMWTTVMQYKTNFTQYDKDGSGDMSAVELRDALSKLGFKLSTPVLSSLTLRYANKKGNVNIDDYLQICCRVKSSFESYLSYQGKSFSLDDYIMSAVYT